MKRLILIGFLVVGGMSFTSCSKSVECKGARKINCISTAELAPVCGCDGITYDNPSIAKCEGVESYTQGACNDKNR